MMDLIVLPPSMREPYNKALKRKFVGLIYTDKRNVLLFNKYRDWCRSQNYPVIYIQHDHQSARRHHLYELRTDQSVCTYNFTQNDFEAIFRSSYFRAVPEEDRARKLRKNEWFSHNLDREMLFVNWLSETEALHLAQSLVKWFDFCLPFMDKTNLHPTENIFDKAHKALLENELDEIYYLYYSRKQRQFQLFAADESRFCGDDWAYLCRDHYRHLIAFLASPDNEKVFDLNCWKAEDFYAVFRRARTGASHWD